MVTGFPILSVLIFFSERHKAHGKLQFLLFVLSVLAGSRLIYLINLGPWLLNMEQCPPLATLWVYTIIQLDLIPAVSSLCAVAAYVWWFELRILL